MIRPFISISAVCALLRVIPAPAEYPTKSITRKHLLDIGSEIPNKADRTPLALQELVEAKLPLVISPKNGGGKLIQFHEIPGAVTASARLG